MIMAWLPAELLYRPAGHRDPGIHQKGEKPILGGGSRKPVFATLSPPGGGTHGSPPCVRHFGRGFGVPGSGIWRPPPTPPQNSPKTPFPVIVPTNFLGGPWENFFDPFFDPFWGSKIALFAKIGIFRGPENSVF